MTCFRSCMIVALLGASGDLAPLANLFLPLIGVGDVYYKGRKREAISVLDEFAWKL